MKSRFWKSKERCLVMVLFTISTLITLNSCDKNKKYDGTIWIGEYSLNIYQEYPLNGYYEDEYYDEESSNVRITRGTFDGDIKLFFTGEGNTVNISGRLTGTLINSYPGFSDEDRINIPIKGSGAYLLDKKDISIYISLDEESLYEMDYFQADIDDDKWTGKVDKNTMTLNNVFGKTVVFKKQ
jgi:hypothetical protein